MANNCVLLGLCYVWTPWFRDGYPLPNQCVHAFLLQQDNEFCIHRQSGRATLLKPTGVIVQKVLPITPAIPTTFKQLTCKWVEVITFIHTQWTQHCQVLFIIFEKWWCSGDGLNYTGDVTWSPMRARTKRGGLDECKMAQNMLIRIQNYRWCFSGNNIFYPTFGAFGPTPKIGGRDRVYTQMKMLQNISKTLQALSLSSRLPLEIKNAPVIGLCQIFLPFHPSFHGLAPVGVQCSSDDRSPLCSVNRLPLNTELI